MSNESCNCVVCTLSRSNRRQAEIIKAQEAAVARVRTLCDGPDYLTPEDVLAAISGPVDSKPAKRADRPKARRPIVTAHLPEQE